MKAFEYATAHSTDSARELVADQRRLSRRRQRPARPAQGLSRSRPEHPRQHQVAARLEQNRARRKKLDHRRAGHRRGNRTRRGNRESFSRPARSRDGNRLAANPQRRHRRRQSRATFALLVFPPARRAVCLKKGGDLCYAREGDNRYHSLFSGNDCISPVVSSLGTTFAALDATAIVLRDGKETRLSMAELYQKAWTEPTAHNSLNPGDLILRVEIPTARSRSAYLQVSDKHTFDWALVSCAAAANVVGRKIKPAARRAGQHLARAASGRGRQRIFWTARPWTTTPRRRRRT